MTSPARRPEPDPPATRQVQGDGHTYVGAMSYAEYRRMDETSELSLEYVGGVVYAMSGGTRAHARIAGNVFARFYALSRGTGCAAYGQGFKVRTQQGNEYVPDALVECGALDANAALFTETPCLVVEVLSPSTARTDLSEKRLAYEEIPTIGAYLIVEAEWRGVHRHWREGAGAWQAEDVVGDGAILLPCPAGAVLTLAEIYEGLNLPSAPPPPPRLRRVHETAPA